MFLRGKPRSNTFVKIFIKEWKTFFEELKQVGLIPKQTKILEGNINPQLKIELKGVDDEIIQIKSK